MVWPSGTLTKANIDQGTDAPSNARAEIEAAIDKINLILAEVSAGSIVWHSGNDGATSGLDADLLDGQHGSYYKDASNLDAGTIPLARLPATLTGKSADQLDGQEGSFYQNASNLNAGIVPLARLSGITAAELATDSVGQDEISSGAVHQGELDTGQSEVTHSSSSGAEYTLPGGEYGFYPNVRHSGPDEASARIANGATNTSYVCNIHLSAVDGTNTAYANQRYVNSSPPHKISNLDYLDFIFIQVDSTGKIISTWIANDPPWYHNGPTKVAPNIKRAKGKKMRRDRIIEPRLLAIKNTDPASYYAELSRLPWVEYEITPELKNADMPLIPHPFASASTDDQIILIEPNQNGVYTELCELFSQGESICDLVHTGYLKIDSTNIRTGGKPPGVGMHRIKWKNRGR